MWARLCSKSFKLVFSSMWIKNFQMYKLGLEKAAESEIKLPTLIGSWRSQGTSTKTSNSASLKAFDCVDHDKLWKFLKRWEYQTTLPASWETFLQVKKQLLQPYMEQLTGSKLGKEYDKAVYCHPAYLTSMQIHHVKCQTGWLTSWNQDCQEKDQQPQICRWYHSNGRKQSGTKRTS